ncbi:GreA/GreB family elongation factor [Flavihumibacter petaseus]|uniref:Nucleoside-diphosphate kinase regulator n=1 Tax=Flavihumibacter petaseus NBRC 106054 TaxID=1220578 RepID=A0A0E9N2Z3_9BACT|nr:GreA/GreB family elongation factor [Flavihumibacter petaseus]GAO44031.1 nucleoside-diphosphate kinase regulator [Flavihumibacter petaseus NBRC 106054]
MKNKAKTPAAVKKHLLLTSDDHELLLFYLKGGTEVKSFDRSNIAALQEELKRAQLVDKADFPRDVVKINSRVKVKMEGKKEAMEFTVVTPDKADIRERKISVLAPVGTALLGFRKGQQVQWEVPAGKKTFTILEVKNE